MYDVRIDYLWRMGAGSCVMAQKRSIGNEPAMPVAHSHPAMAAPATLPRRPRQIDSAASMSTFGSDTSAPTASAIGTTNGHATAADQRCDCEFVLSSKDERK